jgi:hypothetical protein
MRARVSLGANPASDNSPNPILPDVDVGQLGGLPTVSLNVPNLPQHRHPSGSFGAGAGSNTVMIGGPGGLSTGYTPTGNVNGTGALILPGNLTVTSISGSSPADYGILTAGAIYALVPGNGDVEGLSYKLSQAISGILTVEIIGGTGYGATAKIYSVNGSTSSSATGPITAIQIITPGSGYTPGDLVGADFGTSGAPFSVLPPYGVVAPIIRFI